jgi:hypothetical protein
MDATRREELLNGLRDTDTGAVAATVGQVTQVDLDDLDVLDALLAVARRTEPLPDHLQPAAPADPFADFFGEQKERTLKTVGETAAERLAFTGVIGKPDTVTHLAAALETDAPDWLVSAVVKVLGETQWADRVDAVRRLVPPLHRHGAALYAVIVRFGETEHRLMVGSALSPYTSRAVNELLNHGASKPLMEEALGDGIVSGHLSLDEKDAADALTLLVSWGSPWAPRAAASLVDRYPWALLVLGMEDAEAGVELERWLDAGSPAPRDLVRKLHEVLKASDDLPHFPIAAWLRYAGSGIDVVRQWGAAGRCRAELEGFVEAWRDGEHPERGWDALVALCEAGLHANVAQVAVESLQRPDENETWTRARLDAVSLAKPPVPGWKQAVSAAMAAYPKLARVFLPSLQRAYPASELRDVAEAYIALCESRPVVRKPSRKGLIHEEREGVDPVPFQVLVRSLDDAALEARLEAVLPYVRSADA